MNKKVKTTNRRNGRLLIRTEICDFCGSCVAVCPMDCIELTESEISIDLSICDFCMNCVKVCPIHIISEVTE
ncbi:MAG: 4Fe-4S binding protein [candidate division Zixibacteria bacterium]|nr:4Fe-4S binding protein [Candidatus Tariuqbacter arcticus]